MGLRAAVFSQNGLGDGMFTLVLSNNLHLNGWHVDTYHDGIGSMQNWFPHLPILRYPAESEIEKILRSYDWFFVMQHPDYPFFQKLIFEGKRRFPERIKVFYFYASARVVKEPYYEDTRADIRLPVAKNLRCFCEKILKVHQTTDSNGFIPPEDLVFRRYTSQVIIHPTGANRRNYWPKEKFIELAINLKSQGYDPVFIPGNEQIEEWAYLEQLGLSVRTFKTLDLLARFIYESGYFIGNDSGVGHLASFLGIPTLTIARSYRQTRLFRPSYSKGVVITPGSWIPNISGFRLRDRHWKSFISTGKVLRVFKKLACEEKKELGFCSKK